MAAKRLLSLSGRASTMEEENDETSCPIGSPDEVDMQIVQRSQEKMLQSFATQISALEKYESGKILLQPWGHNDAQQFEYEID
eukprot:8929385-Karenia_brevis.AAC.1